MRIIGPMDESSIWLCVACALVSAWSLFFFILEGNRTMFESSSTVITIHARKSAWLWWSIARIWNASNYFEIAVSIEQGKYAKARTNHMYMYLGLVSVCKNYTVRQIWFQRKKSEKVLGEAMGGELALARFPPFQSDDRDSTFPEAIHDDRISEFR